MLYHYRVDLFCNVQSLEELGLDCTLPRKLNKRRKEHDFATKYSFLLLFRRGVSLWIALFVRRRFIVVSINSRFRFFCTFF